MPDLEERGRQPADHRRMVVDTQRGRLTPVEEVRLVAGDRHPPGEPEAQRSRDGDRRRRTGVSGVAAPGAPARARSTLALRLRRRAAGRGRAPAPHRARRAARGAGPKCAQPRQASVMLWPYTSGSRARGPGAPPPGATRPSRPRCAGRRPRPGRPTSAPHLELAPVLLAAVGVRAVDHQALGQPGARPAPRTPPATLAAS